jgi:hypothetical protein
MARSWYYITVICADFVCVCIAIEDKGVDPIQKATPAHRSSGLPMFIVDTPIVHWVETFRTITPGP